MAADTELWTMETETGRRVTCVMRFAEGGVEVVVDDAGEIVARQLFPSGTEAYAWSEDVREQIAANL